MSNETIIETAATDSRLVRVRKLLDKAEAMSLQDVSQEPEQSQLFHAAEIAALNDRAAELIAKYGIDRAMLAAAGTEADTIVDRVVWVVRPFAPEMCGLLWNVAYPLRAKGSRIKIWDETAGPTRRGGVKAGGWKFGLRLFAYASDLERIEMIYASARNQSLAKMAGIKGEHEFGQDAKADKVTYLEGFAAGVCRQLTDAERQAQQVREAEQEEARDQAMLEGTKAGPGVALVLADRRKAVELAMNTAYGITQADEAHWARMAEKRRQELAECKRCQKAKSGRCREHHVPMGRWAPTQRTGSMFSEGYQDGKEAKLVTGTAIGQDGPGELE